MHPSNNNYNSDSILVENYIGGDESSLEKLIRKHKSRIYNFIFSKVLNRDIAEDIFQDTFIKVIKTLKRGFYNEEGKFLPWIMRIAHNLVIDHFRRNNRIPKFESNNDYDIFQNLSDSSPNAEKSIIKDQVSSDLQVLVEELPSDQKDVVIMRLYRDMSFKEIAENTGVSINTALGRMRYALINLRRIIKTNGVILSLD